MTATRVLPELSERSIKATVPGDTLWDAAIKGLHLRHMGTKKVFYLYYRTKAGVQRRPALAPYGSITLAQARKVAQEMLAEVALGGDPSQARANAKAENTLADLWKEFWKRHAKHKKSGTEDERLWLKNIEPRLGKKRLSQIDYAAVSDVHEEISEENGDITANRTLALLSTMMGFAVAPLEWIQKNPCKSVKRNKETKRRRYMTSEEASAIAQVLREKAATYPAGVAFIYLLVLTGARRGELARATWDQLQGNKIVLTEHKTDGDGSYRVIHLPPAAVAIIGQLPKTSGTILGIKSPTTMWESVRKEAGCPDLRIHDLRHSFASAGISAGLTLPQIGELLGHADSQTTKRYAHLVDEAAAKATEMVSGLISERMALT